MRVAIIPARGGSKGVPNKNLMSIAERPLLGHAITCAKDAGCHRVIVSTDCQNISDEARRWDAEVVTRPEELASDKSSSQDALRHALQGIDAEAVAFIQCTTPLLYADDIRGCLDNLPGFDIVACCVRFDGVLLSGDGKLLNRRVGGIQRRQDMPAQFLLTGGCWAFRPSYLVNFDWMEGRVGIHLAKYPHRIEIDSQDDVDLARAAIKSLPEVRKARREWIESEIVRLREDRGGNHAIVDV